MKNKNCKHKIIHEYFLKKYVCFECGKSFNLEKSGLTTKFISFDEIPNGNKWFEKFKEAQKNIGKKISFMPWNK